MNILQVQDRLKGLSEQQLATEMQSPSGMAPQFLVLTELQRRKRVRDDFQAQSAKPATTVAQDAVAAAGVPQEGLAPMARSMAPKTDMAQNTGIMSLAPATPEEPQRMAGGGMVRKMREGKAVFTDPAIRAMALRQRMSVPQWLDSLDPAQAEAFVQDAERRANRDDMLATEPSLSMVAPPSDTMYQGVNPSYEEQTTSVFPDDTQPGLNGLAVEQEPLYPPMPAGNPIPGERRASSAARINPPDWSDRVLSNLGPRFEREGRTPQAGYETQADVIARLQAILKSDIASPMDKLDAARQLEVLASRVAATQYGGSVDAAISGVEVSPGYSMSALGQQPDPNYVTPGRSGVSMVDQEANKGIMALNRLTSAGFVPQGMTEKAIPAAMQADWDRKRAEIDTEQAVIKSQLSNPYLPADTRAELAQRIISLEQGKLLQGDRPRGGVSGSVQAEPGLAPAGGGDPRVSVLGRPMPGAPETFDALTAALSATDASAADAASKPPAETADAAAATAKIKADEAKAAAAVAAEAAAAAGGDGDGNGGGAGGGAGAGGAGGSFAAAGPQTDYEKAIADALARNDKRAVQDKWMAIAQAGLALMSSDNSNLAGALGEAGLAGLESYRGSRDEAEKTRMGLLGTQYEMDMAKQKMAMARAQAAGGGRGGLTAYQMYQMDRNARSDALEQAQALQEYAAGLDPNSAEYLDIQAKLSEFYGGGGAGPTTVRTPSAG